MSDDRSAVERLDYVSNILTADGWPDWLDSTFIDALGPTVHLCPDAPAEAMAELQRLAATYSLRVTALERQRSTSAASSASIPSDTVSSAMNPRLRPATVIPAGSCEVTSAACSCS